MLDLEECGLQRGNIYVKPISGQNNITGSLLPADVTAAGIQSTNTKLLNLILAKSVPKKPQKNNQTCVVALLPSTIF